MVLRRNVFGVELQWDGKKVYCDHQNGMEPDELGEARGVRTATEIMAEAEDNLFEICGAMLF